MLRDTKMNLTEDNSYLYLESSLLTSYLNYMT